MTLMLVYTENSSMMTIVNNDVVKVVNNYNNMGANTSKILFVQKPMKVNIDWQHLIRNNVYKKSKLSTNSLCLNTSSWNSYRGQRKGRVYRIARLPKP